ncbi:MAG: zf-HC2 domain-containing protein [Planctomycetes bacterium]|nr:zf-HC2 domain-containing protein [Planctomycetota bacterium]
MSTCPETGKVAAYHDGELSPDEHRRMERHIEGCRLCSRELAELRRLSSLLQSAQLPRMPEDALERLRARCARARERSLVRTAETFAAVAAGIAVACLVLFYREPSAQPSGIARIARNEVLESVVLSAGPDAGLEANGEYVLARWMVADLSLENGK